MAKHPLVILSSDSEGRTHLTRCLWSWLTRAKELWLEQEVKQSQANSFPQINSRRELESEKVRQLNKHGNV